MKMDSGRQAYHEESTVLYSRKFNRVRSFIRLASEGEGAGDLGSSDALSNGHDTNNNLTSDNKPVPGKPPFTGLQRAKTFASIDVRQRKKHHSNLSAFKTPLTRSMTEFFSVKKKVAPTRSNNHFKSASMSTFENGLHNDVIKETDETMNAHETISELPKSDIKSATKRQTQLKSASFSSFDYTPKSNHSQVTARPHSNYRGQLNGNTKNANVPNHLSRDISEQTKRLSTNLQRSTSLTDGNKGHAQWKTFFEGRNRVANGNIHRSQSQEKVDNATSRLQLRFSSARPFSSQLNIASRSPHTTSRSISQNNAPDETSATRTRSQSARRDVRANQIPGHQQRPRTGLVIGQTNGSYSNSSKTIVRPDTAAKHPAPRIQRSRPVTARRSKGTNSIVKRKEEDDQEPAAEIDASERMSTELPPINRPESSLSKRTYSRESLSNIPHTPSPSGPVLPRQERAPLLTIDCNPAAYREGNQSPYSPTRRSRVSPGSQNSGSSTNSKGYSSQHATSLTNSRNKSWATSESTSAPKQQLETLFEQKHRGSLTNGVDSGVESFELGQSSVPPHHRDRRNNMKPPQKQTSYSSSLANATLAGKRATSTSNLTRTSDNSSGKNNNVPNTQPTQGIASLNKPIQRIRSENNVLNHGSTKVRMNNQSMNTSTTTPDQNVSSKQRTFNRVRSQPELIDQRQNKQSKKSLKHLSKNKVTEEGSCDSNEEEEQNDRIVQWLVGLERAETPPTQEIFDDEPVQTDTAIHIVYNDK